MAKDPTHNLQNATKRPFEEGRRAAESVADAGQSFGQTGADALNRSSEAAQAGFQTLMQSGTVIADGMQAITKEVLEVTQQNLHRHMSQMRELGTCTSPTEIFAIQSRQMRENMEAFIAGTRRISEVATKITQDAAGKLGKLPPS